MPYDYFWFSVSTFCDLNVYASQVYVEILTLRHYTGETLTPD